MKGCRLSGASRLQNAKPVKLRLGCVTVHIHSSSEDTGVPMYDDAASCEPIQFPNNKASGEQTEPDKKGEREKFQLCGHHAEKSFLSSLPSSRSLTEQREEESQVLHWPCSQREALSREVTWASEGV
ncbi:hypothetical protein AOLI_G00000430 [Acnodon oligacanthus]